MRLSEMTGEHYARLESEYLDEREPACDVCGTQHGGEGCE